MGKHQVDRTPRQVEHGRIAKDPRRQHHKRPAVHCPYGWKEVGDIPSYRIEYYRKSRLWYR